MALVEQPRVRARARINRPLVLAAIVAGASVEEVARDLKITSKRVEKLLRRELQKRWVAPAQEHARLQIARLETIANRLKDKAGEGDLPTIDRLLRVLDRLDRYHGHSRLTGIADAAQSEDVRDSLTRKIAATAQLPPPGDA